jgi:hypothetical protein
MTRNQKILIAIGVLIVAMFWLSSIQQQTTKEPAPNAPAAHVETPPEKAMNFILRMQGPCSKPGQVDECAAYQLAVCNQIKSDMFMNDNAILRKRCALVDALLDRLPGSERAIIKARALQLAD